MLKAQQFAPTHGSALRRPGAYEPQPTGFLSTDNGLMESPSKPLPDQGATRIRFPKFADEPNFTSKLCPTKMRNREFYNFIVDSPCTLDYILYPRLLIQNN